MQSSASDEVGPAVRKGEKVRGRVREGEKVRAVEEKVREGGGEVQKG